MILSLLQIRQVRTAPVQVYPNSFGQNNIMFLRALPRVLQRRFKCLRSKNTNNPVGPTTQKNLKPAYLFRRQRCLFSQLPQPTLTHPFHLGNCVWCFGFDLCFFTVWCLWLWNIFPLLFLPNCACQMYSSKTLKALLGKIMASVPQKANPMLTRVWELVSALLHPENGLLYQTLTEIMSQQGSSHPILMDKILWNRVLFLIYINDFAYLREFWSKFARFWIYATCTHH